MKASEFREMTQAEIESALHDLKEELFSLRFQKAKGNLQNPMRFKQIGKDIARLKTVLTEKEKEGDKEKG
ncbi:50S ribosomal protein L29 [candidate division WOR-3 bacterium]|nr:50S ribosomal protein L29 [candidate division WOR-3 bacterium]MCK4526819.1 50S ribosomal protein L29 [candidate division WOR-3 bacterium]